MGRVSVGEKGHDEVDTHRPMLMAVVGWFAASGPAEALLAKRWRSPRRKTSAIRTVRPPSMMFGLPSILARREILLPVSWMGC